MPQNKAKTNLGRMAQASQKKTKKKKQSGNPNPANITSLTTEKLVHRICGLSDPFCSHARGSKYPDDSSVRTVPYSYEGLFTLTTDANGDACCLFWPQYTYLAVGTASAATFPSVTGWTARTNLPPLGSVQQYRIVSTGFSVRRISAPLTSSGMVHIRSWPVEALDNLGAVDLTAYNATACMDVPLQDCTDLAVAAQHTSQMPQTFYQVSGDTGTVTSGTTKGFNPITIYVAGGPATSAVVQMHYIIHYELIFLDSSGMAQIATPPPPSNALVTAAANSVTSVMEPIAVHGVKVFGDAVVRAAKSAISRVLLGPTASAVAMILD